MCNITRVYDDSEPAVKSCKKCGSDVTKAADKCTECHGVQFSSKKCTRDSRIGMYVSRLITFGLWPIRPMLQQHNVHYLMVILRRMRSNVETECEGDHFCPVGPTMEEVIVKCDEILNTVNGLCLGCFRGGKGNGFDLRDHEGQCYNRTGS